MLAGQVEKMLLQLIALVCICGAVQAVRVQVNALFRREIDYVIERLDGEKHSIAVTTCAGCRSLLRLKTK